MALRSGVRPTLVAAVAAAASFAASSGASPGPTFHQLLDAGIPIYCGGGTGPYVALTFDDGPGPYTSQLVALLKRYHARATFFVIGRKAVRRPDLIRMQASVGTLGDHSFTHPTLGALPRHRPPARDARGDVEPGLRRRL